MSSYTKSTDFASKDALLTGNPLKVVKGTEIDDEYNAIQTAVNSKADTNSPALTGTPTAPTAATTTSTTQIASTAFVQQEITANATDLSAAWPVGSIYMNATSSTNPGTLLGFGTWVSFGAGRVLVGLDSGDTDFDTAEETGGSKDSDLQAHTHLTMGYTGGGLPSGGGGGYTTTVTDSNRLNAVAAAADSDTSYALKGTTNAADRGLTSETGSGDGTGNNLQPYIVVYMWKRTA